MSLSDKELMMIEDTDFLFKDSPAFCQLKGVFDIKFNGSGLIITKRNDKIFQENDFGKGKISKGENYRSLPFVILDFPAIFDSKNVFAFRTMFWWGNFFSATLHLQGRYFEHLKPKLLANFDLLLNQNIYICVAETPWEYHYGKDNYVQLLVKHKEFIENSPFVKLSKRIQLEQIESVPQFASSFFLNLLKVLSE